MQVTSVRLYFLPVVARIPYQFGAERMTQVHCARVCLRVRGGDGREAEGWGETPLNVGWVWPGNISYRQREEALKQFCVQLAHEWKAFDGAGHPLEIGNAFQERTLPKLLEKFNQGKDPANRMPWLAALVCTSPFDLALYDAFANLVQKPVYETLGKEFLYRDLSAYLEPADGTSVSFSGKYPSDYLTPRQNQLLAWHSVGGDDAITPDDLTGSEPADGYPVHLREWIRRDGLKCLKIKLRGFDFEWDYGRLVAIGKMGIEEGVDWLCADFNCTAPDPEFVIAMLDRLLLEHPRIFGMLLYVEQPFPYELERHPFDVHGISARKPLFMDESAHDWRLIRYGRGLGWSSVALKTCKTQTVALLSLCWARAHGMTLMVQDLTNPMLAMIPHAMLAAHAGPIMGLESNAPQFYPEASSPEASVHPGIYRRRNGRIDLSSLIGSGFGYRIDEIRRVLPEAAAEC